VLVHGVWNFCAIPGFHGGEEFDCPAGLHGVKTRIVSRLRIHDSLPVAATQQHVTRRQSALCSIKLRAMDTEK
jgi:hypothetical protein